MLPLWAVLQGGLLSTTGTPVSRSISLNNQ
jgi:hypothetical protein